MKAYLAVAKNKHWVQIVTAKNSEDLFWAIDEFSDPYSFVFKCINQGFVSQGVAQPYLKALGI